VVAPFTLPSQLLAQARPDLIFPNPLVFLHLARRVAEPFGIMKAHKTRWPRDSNRIAVPIPQVVNLSLRSTPEMVVDNADNIFEWDETPVGRYECTSPGTNVGRLGDRNVV
jgi:hypothetical protein